MDFSLSKEQKLIQKAVYDYSHHQIKPMVDTSLCQDLVGGTPGLRKIIFILSREGSNLGDFP